MSHRLSSVGVKPTDFKMLQSFRCWTVETIGWMQDPKWETGPIARVEMNPDCWVLPD